jgi:uncharacterized protein (TIGR02246 family)
MVKHFIYFSLLIGPVQVAFAQNNPADETAIRALVQEQEDAWNRNDMSGYCSFFADDASWINIGGLYWKNKAEIVKAHLAFAPVLKFMVPAKVKIQNIQFIAPAAAIVIIEEAIKMNHDLSFPDGRGVAAGDTIKDRISLVLVKSSGRWVIIAGHNTSIDPASEKINPVSEK